MAGFVANGTHISRNSGETEALGAELAGRLRAGHVVLVEGELGAGKTTFVRGACRSLGVRTTVRSPTFTIGHRYPAPVPVSHLDLFRIGEGLGAEEPDLLDDYLRGDAIAFVEWPPAGEGLLSLGSIAARVRIAHAGGDERTIEIELDP
jgi:tRNA threonylcarbamoyladenosine biosynthesis protein TsaE